MKRALAWILLAALPASAQAPKVPPLEALALIHLPSSSLAHPPVLVLFDPGGDAQGALRRAVPVADAEGVALVVSKAFRDGLDDAAYTRILSELKTDLAQRFPDSPIWAGGFSGGARIAVGWAQQERGWLRGVICFGAFYDQGGLPPAKTAVFLACGTGDFDRDEMQRALAELRQGGYLVVWRSFFGGHTWPPVAVMAGALRFLKSKSGPGSE